MAFACVARCKRAIWGDWGLSAGVDAELRNDNSGRENAVRRSMGGMAGCALGESQASMAPL